MNLTTISRAPPGSVQLPLTALGGGVVMAMLVGCGWLTGPGEASPVQPPLFAAQLAEDGIMPAQANTGGEAVFIVKVEGVPEFQNMARMCRKDMVQAQAVFADWSRGEPGLDGLRLEACSYSGELILVYHFADGEVASPAAVDARLAKIRAHPKVAYADPDFAAYIEKER